MKKYCILVLALVLTLAVFTGCGCRKQDPMDMKPTDEMTIAPTVKPTDAPTEQTQTPTQRPTDAPDATIIPDVTGGEETGTGSDMGDMDATGGTETGNARNRPMR